MVAAIQKSINFVLPTGDEEWDTIPRLRFRVRREHLLEDALEKWFDPAKLLDLSCHIEMPCLISLYVA